MLATVAIRRREQPDPRRPGKHLLICFSPVSHPCEWLVRSLAVFPTVWVPGRPRKCSCFQMKEGGVDSGRGWERERRDEELQQRSEWVQCNGRRRPRNTHNPRPASQKKKTCVSVYIRAPNFRSRLCSEASNKQHRTSVVATDTDSRRSR